MNCEKARDLIATEYIDRELPADAEAAVRKHLAVCAACKAYETTLIHAAVRPFRGAPRIKPPAHVWERIREAVADEPRRRPVWAFPRSVFVAATAAMFLVAFALFAHVRQADTQSLHAYIEEEMLFLSGLDENGTGVSDEELYTIPAGEKYSAARNFRAGIVV